METTQNFDYTSNLAGILTFPLDVVTLKMLLPLHGTVVVNSSCLMRIPRKTNDRCISEGLRYVYAKNFLLLSVSLVVNDTLSVYCRRLVLGISYLVEI